MFACGIQNPGLWNPEYSAAGIRNPGSTDKDMESSTWSPKSTGWNPEPKPVLGRPSVSRR